MTLVSLGRTFDQAGATPVRVQWAPPAPSGIAHIVNSTRWGGMEARTLETAQWQADRGLRTLIVTPREGVLFAEAQRRRLPVQALDFDAGNKLGNLWAMRAAFQRHRIDLGDFHTNRSLALGVRDLASLVRTQHVLRRARPGSLRLNKEFPFDGFILSSQAGSDVLAAQGYARADRIAVVGEWAHERFFAPPPSAEERAARRLALGVRAGDFVIGAVGMLRPDNAFDELIRATARLRAQRLPVSCLVVGGGMHRGDEPCEQMRMLQDLARSLGVADSVHFLGHRDDGPDLLQLMDVVAVISRHTAQTRIAPEAAACGRAVVGFDVGALRETVRHGRTGLLTPLGDLDAFVATLARLLVHRVERDRLGADAARFARTAFSEAASMERTLEAYRLAMSRRGRILHAPAPMAAAPAAAMLKAA